MNKKIQYSSFIATSLDGKIAKQNGDIEWLNERKYILADEDFGYKDFYSSVDCLVIGKNTFEKILQFPEYPYEDKKLWVLSKNYIKIPENLKDKVNFFSGTITELDKLLLNQKIKRVYVDGDKVISSYLALNLLSEITITTLPILLGEGISLWLTDLTWDKAYFKPTNSKLYSNGFVQTKYNFDYLLPAANQINKSP